MTQNVGTKSAFMHKKKINLNVLSKKREEKIATFPKGNNCFSCKSTSYIFIIMKFPCFARDIVQTRRMFDWVFREDEKKKRRENIFGEYLVEGKRAKKNDRARVFNC